MRARACAHSSRSAPRVSAHRLALVSGESPLRKRRQTIGCILKLRRLVARLSRIVAACRPSLVAPDVITPGVRQAQDLTWLRGLFQRGDAGLYNRALIGRVERLAAGVSEWIVKEDGARRLARLHDVECTGQADCRDAMRFEVSRDQTHGLVTHGSHRYEQDRVYLLTTHGVEHGRRQFVAHPALRIDAAHAREHLIGELTDNASID